MKSRLAWFHEYSPGSYPIWVAEGRGEITGWLSFESSRERPAYHATAEVNVYVVENHRRKGLGRRIVAETIRYGAGRAFRESRSSTAPSGIRRPRPKIRQSLKGKEI